MCKYKIINPCPSILIPLHVFLKMLNTLNKGDFGAYYQKCTFTFFYIRKLKWSKKKIYIYIFMLLSRSDLIKLFGNVTKAFVLPGDISQIIQLIMHSMVHHIHSVASLLVNDIQWGTFVKKKYYHGKVYLCPKISTVIH